MKRDAQPRGRPMIAMATVLAVWVSLRVVFWQSPLMLPELALDPSPDAGATGQPARTTVQFSAAGDRSALRILLAVRPGTRAELTAAGSANSPGVAPLSAFERPPGTGGLVGQTVLSAARLPNSTRSQTITPSTSLGEPFALATAKEPQQPPAAGSVGRSRWSMSSWLFWRDGSPTGRQAATNPGYGRSQAGAVLAYGLAPGDAHLPQAYARAVAALEGSREADLAAGISARPAPGLPLRLAAEARVSLRDGETELRPAAFAVTELPPLALPARFVGEAYAQAGWVGGDFATVFADAQARVTRPLARFDEATLALGGGAWIGAQRDTRRVDIGPSASVSFRLNPQIYGRLSLDYRLRVAGNAAPASGPALTLSAGF